MFPSLSFSHLCALVAFALAGLTWAGGAPEQSWEQSRKADETCLVQVGVTSLGCDGARERKPSDFDKGTSRATKLATYRLKKDIAVDPHPDASGMSGACSETDRAIAFKELKAAESEVAAQRLFLTELGTATRPSEVLFTSRHKHSLRDQKLTEESGRWVPKFMRMFDWYQLGEQQNLTHGNPKTVLCQANKRDLDNLWEHVQTLPALEAGEKRLLAVGNSDSHLTKNAESIELFQSSGRFSRIIYEANDGRMPGVGTFPLGLSDIYVAMNGPQNVMKAVREASLQKKDKHLLAAWGRVWKLLDTKLASRRLAQQFVHSSCFVNRTMVEPEDYWEVLSQHRFLMAPSGNGVQSPKVAEALLVLTIPIVNWTPAYADMVNDGWPMVVVKTWEEITPASLVRWHAELSPKLHAFRLRLTASRAFDELVHGP
uniref:Exostosin GT47 domain-containing protein n=1 Tax=Alexandrium catenella TaxID=2925 RepID=A0A7S1RA65_ALECA|mmetsp:Transcript_48977/g.131075  ORF Transcript_48977/g.131075 Transcript_48977/m.131075 type:complete len:429 (+) Transcript_48977:70-1356(+)